MSSGVLPGVRPAGAGAGCTTTRWARIPLALGLISSLLTLPPSTAAIITAAALNVVRAGAWLLDVPRAQTRQAPFVTLALAPCPA